MIKRKLPKKDVSSKIAEAVAEFNKYRSPEATARLVSAKQGEFEVDFSGPFCHSCGFHDYFDDFIITLQEAGAKVKISRIKEHERGALVGFITI